MPASSFFPFTTSNPLASRCAIGSDLLAYALVPPLQVVVLQLRPWSAQRVHQSLPPNNLVLTPQEANPHLAFFHFIYFAIICAPSSPLPALIFLAWMICASGCVVIPMHSAEAHFRTFPPSPTARRVPGVSATLRQFLAFLASRVHWGSFYFILSFYFVFDLPALSSYSLYIHLSNDKYRTYSSAASAFSRCAEEDSTEHAYTNIGPHTRLIPTRKRKGGDCRCRVTSPMSTTNIAPCSGGGCAPSSAMDRIFAPARGCSAPA
ncbi:hypothetical protein B0H13DRAFT_2326550 [Mycena leptocephala]|nr:hypothetical protein B0H13DRAFT_2326550 [Mycena leptocephala]